MMLSCSPFIWVLKGMFEKNPKKKKINTSNQGMVHAITEVLICAPSLSVENIWYYLEVLVPL